MSKELEELYELEKELQEKMKDHYIPPKNNELDTRTRISKETIRKEEIQIS
jgi:hypothetical protein